MKAGFLALVVLALILAVILVGGAGALYFSGGVFEMPSLPRVSHVPSDGYRAQEKLLGLVMRESKHSSPLVLTEPELNAFLTRHLAESEGIPFSPLIVKLTSGRVEVQGRTPLKTLFRGFPFSLLPVYLPAHVVDRPVWVTLAGTIEVRRGRTKDGGHSGRLGVSEFRLGTQNLGPWVLYVMLGQTERELLSWKVPAAVDTITVHDGQVVISTRT